MKCDEAAARADELAREILSLTLEWEAKCEHGSCLVLYGTLLDSAIRIQKAVSLCLELRRNESRD